MLTEHALSVLERRFLLRDNRGQLAEDADGLFRRVARAIAAIDAQYGEDPAPAEERFFELMRSLTFLPNSPTLMNAGTCNGQLAGCFVLPIEDSMDSIYTTLHDAALVQKSGGGTGFSFSKLRPRGDFIEATRGQSSGPVSFIDLFDYSTRINRLGGTRAGANMAVLRADHPDIREFVEAKHDPERLTSFNVSVLVDDAFMLAVERGDDIHLRFPEDGPVREHVSARVLFESIVDNAWRTGDPGLLFGDRINAANPTPSLGRIDATNPCGEQPLLPYESCNLGSINLARFVRAGSIDYDSLKPVIHDAVHFLDNVLDANVYPVEAIRRATLGNRKIGLGIMGFADALVALDIPYASDAAILVAEEVMRVVQHESHAASAALAELRGAFPHFVVSRFAGGPARRNACVTSIAPTGTISLIADCSSGIEPFFALAYRRDVIGVTNTIDVHSSVVDALRRHGLDSRQTITKIRVTGRLESSAAERMRHVFATAHEIAPEWHVKMQAAFQRHTDTSVSKTINLVESATHSDIDAAYRLAFELRCKGLTVFRDGCKKSQVLRTGTSGPSCPECSSPLVTQGGCESCTVCGYSVCAV